MTWTPLGAQAGRRGGAGPVGGLLGGQDPTGRFASAAALANGPLFSRPIRGLGVGATGTRVALPKVVPVVPVAAVVGGSTVAGGEVAADPLSPEDERVG